MRVLFLGEDPETVDFSDPAISPGTDAAKIRAGIDKVMAEMRGRGWSAEECMVAPEIGRAVAQLEAALGQGAPFDCVVVGAGLRLPAGRLTLFEALVNAVRRAAPDAALAFNSSPADTAEAAARQAR